MRSNDNTLSPGPYSPSNTTIVATMNDAQPADFDFTEYIRTAPSSNEPELDIFADFQRPAQVMLDNLPQNQSQVQHQNSSQQHQQQHQQQTQQQNQHLQQSQQQNQHLQQQHQQQQHQQHQHQQFITAEMQNLKDRLEQQMKLQQLQQLILQQQIELLNGNSQGPSSHILDSQQKDGLYNGLPTPIGSAELPAIVPKDQVPPMMLQPDIFMSSANNVLSPHLQSHHGHVINPNPSFSAPAALAFPTSQPFPLPGPDISPLTSPWILPYGHVQRPSHSQTELLHLQNQLHDHQQLPSPHERRHNTARPHLKRTGSVDEHITSQQPARKRSFRITPTSSATSTPADGNNGHHFISSNDTPSPVDLPMPPPVSSNGMSSTPSTSGSGAVTSHSNVAIAPMTPASILNLRKLSTGLVSSSIASGSSAVSGSTGGDPKETAKKPNKGKSAVSTLTRGRRGSTAKSGFSPNLKPLLPGAQPLTPTSPLSLPTPSSNIGRPSKSSHKVAEQKRRDSLKTSFDELRLLLPPVALPEDEELLPGCMPPRGPPKGDADGPNRGVSKLALLRCGNAYIKELKDMVKRRDGEIGKLRSEVKRVRELLGDAVDGEDDVKVDLDCDVDEGRCVEAGIRLKMGNTSGGDDEDD